MLFTMTWYIHKNAKLKINDTLKKVLPWCGTDVFGQWKHVSNQQ